MGDVATDVMEGSVSTGESTRPWKAERAVR